MEWLFITGGSLFAGFVDSIVGGGGLISIPVFFAVFPKSPPATLLGTNKLGSVFGTAFAAWRYARKVRFTWHVILPAAIVAMIGAFLGSWSVTLVSPALLRKSLPFILIFLLIYTWMKKDFGLEQRSDEQGIKPILWACAIGGVIGFYDGFFGPGSGSIFMFAFVRFLGYDFLNASANAKLLNGATNIASILLFGLTGHVWWHFAPALAIANIVGSFLGTMVALRYGAGFVRWVFLIVVSILIFRTAFDAFFH